MNCLKCDREVVEHAKFCSYCGERLAVACSSCAVLNPPDGLFCHDCGRSLTETGSQVESPEFAQPRQPSAVAWGCPRCSVSNEPGSVYCYRCGLPLEEEVRTGHIPVDGQVHAFHPYRSPWTHANWTVGLLVTTCIAYALHMALTFELLGLVSQQQAGQFVSRAELNDAMQSLDGMLILLVLVYIPTMVLFLMWTHRASRNLQSLGSHGQRFSPGWAVGWWFVPIMFFFRPYQVMAEIWRGSDPNMPWGSNVDWKEAPVSALLAWWWLLWVASNLVGSIAGYSFGFTGAFDTDAIPSSAALRWDVLASALVICDGVLAILVVRRITNREEEKRLGIPTG